MVLVDDVLLSKENLEIKVARDYISLHDDALGTENGLENRGDGALIYEILGLMLRSEGKNL